MSPKNTIYNQFFKLLKWAAFFTTQEKNIKLRPRQDSNLESHRRTGYFLPGGAVNHLPKKFLQVAQNSRTEIRADATT